MSKIQARKVRSKPNSSTLHKEQRTSAECLRETKVVIKCENIETQDTIPVLDGEPKNCGKHLRLVEKDLLEFTNSLSKTIGSRRKNVLSALLVTADIQIPASEDPEPAHSGPIHACLCELKGRDEGNVVICEKNCCCLIFLETCHCGLQPPANPAEIICTKQTAIRSNKHHGDESAATGIKGSGGDYLASTAPKLGKNLPHRSIQQNARKCSHGSRKQMAGKTESCSQPSATRLATRTASAHPHVAKNTWCRVVELTEREHLILLQAEKWQKSITKLSRSTRKNHGVRIFLMKQLREVHVRGTKYHQGLQELLQEIKRATEWWENHRNAINSDMQLMEITKEHESSVTSTVVDGTAVVKKHPPNRTRNFTKSEPAAGVVAKSPVTISSFKTELEHTDVKSTAVMESLSLPMRRAKNDAIQKIHDSLTSPPVLLKRSAGIKFPPPRLPQTARQTGGPPVLKLQTARRTGGPPVQTPQTTRPTHFWLQGPGDACRRLVATNGSRRTMLHKITLCPKKHAELMSKPELAEKVKKLQKYFLLQGSRIDFKVWLSTSKAVLVLVCGAEDFERSYAAVLDHAARMGIRRYFPNVFEDEPDDSDERLDDPAAKRTQVRSTPLAENSAASKVTQGGSSSNVEKTGTSNEPAKTGTTSLLSLDNAAIKAQTAEISTSCLTTGGSAVDAKGEPPQEFSVPSKEPQQVPPKRPIPTPGPPIQPPHPSYVPSVEFSPQFLYAPNRGSPYYDYNGNPLTPMAQSNSGPMPINGFHPHVFTPAQQLPIWNNFNHFPTNYAPNNPTLAHTSLPFQFLGGQNVYHYLTNTIHGAGFDQESLHRMMDAMREGFMNAENNPHVSAGR